ncbi:MAG TPA: helix-turn-helix transcriptional regulator [Verrucomicrobiae bacterium]
MPKKSGLETPREKQIGDRVKQFRDQINWPQSPFAVELGISHDKLASIEYGRTPLKYAIGYRLCFIFDVNHRWLTNGEGEVKAATAALELPRPEDVDPRTLWSEIAPKAGSGRVKRASANASESKKSQKGELIPRFDATNHVVSFMSNLLAKEKFHSPLARQEFALEVTSFAHQLSLRLRREGAKDRHVEAASRDGEASGRDGAVGGLRESIRHLDQHLKKLQATMEKGGKVSGKAGSEPEVVRLQETIEKIGGQIQSVEEGLKILLAKRPE